MSITNFNKSTFIFQAGEDFEYRKLEELFNENGKDRKYRVRGLYINTKSQFGDSPVAITDNEYVNLPKHLLNSVKEIIERDDLVDDINNLKVGFEIYQYMQPKYNRICYSIRWVELEPETVETDILPF